MISIVVPTLGRPSLTALLDALAPQLADLPDVELLLVDDRYDATGELAVPGTLSAYAKVLTGRGAGPAAARNIGWRAARQPWVVFLDDDVVPARDWAWRLRDDLAVGDRVGGVQGLVEVPLPADRRPTDWERGTAGLAEGEWITADMAYRRAALATVDGFDERFPRAYREDAELAHRVRRAGWELVRGRRTVTHPVRPEDRWVSLRVQRGNADDALLRRLYGPQWRAELGLPPGRRPRHVAVTAAGVLALAAGALR
ncbi:glycosyltransferase, partial [Micromonospora sp. CPCC 205711]|uniref:glycosyltransferase family 2 protein n=1 Tax=Micromonospora sp. CPCC 205547 TaxID=3122400 RepID=UPI002FF186D7